MKKSILLAIVCLLLCGCSRSSFNGFEVSELKIEESSHDIGTVIGTIQNNSGKDCNQIKIDIRISSGSITTETSFGISETVKNGEIYNFHELATFDGIQNASDYNVKVTSIECLDID